MDFFVFILIYVPTLNCSKNWGNMSLHWFVKDHKLLFVPTRLIESIVIIWNTPIKQAKRAKKGQYSPFFFHYYSTRLTNHTAPLRPCRHKVYACLYKPLRPCRLHVYTNLYGLIGIKCIHVYTKILSRSNNYISIFFLFFIFGYYIVFIFLY